MSRRRRVKSPDLMTLLGEFTGVYLPLDREVSPLTIESYSMALDLYEAYLKETGGADGDPDVKRDGFRAAKKEHFNAKNVSGYLIWLRDGRGNKSRTLKQRRSAITSFVDYAAGEDLSWSSILVDLQKNVKIGERSTDRIVGFMSEEAWDAVMSQPQLPKRTEHRNWALMALMYETGARNHEVIGLRVKDVILTPGDEKVHIRGKGGKHRMVPIRAETASIVRDYVARFHRGDGTSSAPLFFVNHDGEKRPLSPDCVEAFLKRYGQAARRSCPKVPERVHPHLIRHTRAMHLREGGMSEEDLAELLGHSDTKTVKVYAQASVEMKRKAMEKASGKPPEKLAEPGFWEGDESVIARLENPRAACTA